MNVSQVRAVLFVKDLERVAAFYTDALGMAQSFADQQHAVLHCGAFELIVHRIPKHIADTIAIKQPPERRVGSAVRLDYPVASIEESRRRARALGGDIDEAPPAWADASSRFFFGYDPEGNQFGVSLRESA
jgi:predicted enzyme related to lactoylglutathione lyase